LCAAGAAAGGEGAGAEGAEGAAASNASAGAEDKAEEEEEEEEKDKEDDEEDADEDDHSEEGAEEDEEDEDVVGGAGLGAGKVVEERPALTSDANGARIELVTLAGAATCSNGTAAPAGKYFQRIKISAVPITVPSTPLTTGTP
jgi:hypothetical protein